MEQKLVSIWLNSYEYGGSRSPVQLLLDDVLKDGWRVKEFKTLGTSSSTYIPYPSSGVSVDIVGGWVIVLLER